MANTMNAVATSASVSKSMIVWIICGIIYLSPLIKTTSADNLGPPCCSESNIFETSACLHNGVNSNVLLKCADGYLLIDSESEQFEIQANGDLFKDNDGDSYTIPKSLYCTTNFLTVESNVSRLIALSCIIQQDQSPEPVFLVKAVLAFISVAFLLATLYVYWIIPSLRETLDKVTCIALCCLICLFTFLGIAQTSLLSDGLCVPFAFFIYVFTIAYFAWMNMLMANVWKSTVMLNWKIKERNWFILNNLYGWGVPLAMTIFLLVSHITENAVKPDFGIQKCWFAKRRETWIFVYYPVSIMLLLNLALFIWSAVALHRLDGTISSDKHKALIFRCKLYLKLFFLSGMTWVFEVLSFHFSSPGNTEWYWMIADIVNVLHGVLIFFVLIVWRRRVRRELGGKRICCFVFPKVWSELMSIEAQNLNDETDDHTRYDLVAK